jgi:hypothetical protein
MTQIEPETTLELKRVWVGSHKFSYPKPKGGPGDWSAR